MVGQKSDISRASNARSQDNFKEDQAKVMVRVKSGKRQVVGAGAEVCVLMAGLSCTLSSVPRRDRI